MAFAVAVMGLNIVTGFSGQISLGHSAFMGTGAYTTAILVADHDWSFFATIPVAALLCFVVGIAGRHPRAAARRALPGARDAGPVDHLPEARRQVRSLTGGRTASGWGATRLLPPEWTHLDPQADATHLDLLRGRSRSRSVLFVACSQHVSQPAGRALIALRDNPIGAEVSGVNLARYKVLAFGISAVYAGIAGSLFMFDSDIASGSSYSLNRSIELVTGVVIGGLATIVGPVIGGLLVVFLPDGSSRTEFTGRPA